MNKILNLPVDNYLVVGSYPLGIRYAKDIDIICYKKDIQTEVANDDYITSFQHNGRRVECLLADNQESLQFALQNWEDTTYGLLWAIKKGHIVHPHQHWKKHISDLHLLKHLKQIDDMQDKADEMWKLHRKSTAERIKIRTPKLKGVTKEAFFDDYVKKFIEHDLIHEVMAHKSKPMYTYMQKDSSLVECHKELWEQFIHQEKIWCVMEEAYVIAAERILIPSIVKGENYPKPKITAFEYALNRICTTLCSGWFREFAIDNYFEIINQYDESKFQVLKTLNYVY